MEPKTVVVKSKSSNGATPRIEKRNKYSRSDMEFQPSNVKKRGVYVENKDNNMLFNVIESNDAEVNRKPPPRPRPGQKRFLTSVLNILSKSTTGTQYPDHNNSKKYGTKRKTIRNKNIKQDDDVTFVDEEFVADTQVKNKKQKYKSKTLNSKGYMSPINDKFVILQSKKDIIHTPSNFSGLSKSFTLNESKNPIRDLLENNIYSGVAEGIAKEILEGRVLDKPVRIQEDPLTLVADVPPKDDKNIYNFFVDLLETTFDVYNVKTDPAVINNDSDEILEIDETVAKKLNFKNDCATKEKEHDHNHELNFDIKEDKPFVSLSEYMPDAVKVKKTPKPKSVKAKSLIYPKQVITPKPSNAIMRRKPLSKAAKKKVLLNTIKEELKIDFYKYEEPQNLYQALRNMAKYKRKCQEKKTIQFDTDNRKYMDKECIFSQGIFPIKKFRKRTSTHEKPKAEKKLSDFKYKNLLKTQNAVVIPSNHSLEVYEYEMKEKPYNCGKKQCFKYSDDSDFDFDPNSILGISDSSINMKQFYSLFQD
ncbi:unnamed protein product [Colias eurytheme]|nr:unnamed protein product [Colias eurytheme]